MVDHIHVLVDAPNKKWLGDFMRYYTSRFSREYNAWHGLKGADFQKAFRHRKQNKVKRHQERYCVPIQQSCREAVMRQAGAVDVEFSGVRSKLQSVFRTIETG
jgi:REP element-mobilizing transposase RayT